MSPYDRWKLAEPEEGEPEPELSDSELEEASLFASIEAIVDEGCSRCDCSTCLCGD